MNEYNSTCPFCGHEGELRATVETVDSNVPLRPNGFDTDDGDPETSDLREIICRSCQREVNPIHYFNHGPNSERCDCAATVTS